MNFESFLARLKGVSRNGTKATALCPAHDDHRSSLSVTQKDGRLLVRCFAGCAVTAIVTALGLTTSDLFTGAESRRASSQPLTLEAFAKSKALPVDFLRAEGVEQDGSALRITYRLADGSLAPRQRRRSALRAKDGSSWYPGDGKPVPYGLPDLAQARDKGFLILVEGETDRLTAKYHGLPALGIPGADMGRTLQADHILGIRRIYVWKEPDKGGDVFVRGIARRLLELARTSSEPLRVVKVLVPPDGIKDLNDLHRDAPEQFQRRLAVLQLSAATLDLHAAADATVPTDPDDPNTDWAPPIPFHTFGAPPFPTETYPAWLANFVRAEAVATQTPEDLPAMVGLSILATACAKKVVVEVKPGYREPLNVYAVTVLPPGNRKSAVLQDVAAPVEAHEAELLAAAKPRIAEIKNRRKVLQSAIEKRQTQAAKAEGAERDALVAEAAALIRDLDATPEPVEPRLIVDDITPEKVANILAEQGGRIAVLSAEGGIFEIMAGRYAKDRAPNFEVFLKGHSGDQLRVDRMTRPSEFVAAPAITIGLTVQPAVLAAVHDKPGFRGRGLLGRFWYSLPVSPLGHRLADPPVVPPSMRAAFDERITKLLRHPVHRGSDGNVLPDVLTLDPDAKRAYVDLHDYVEPQLAPHGELGHMTDWGGKLVGAVVRIAALLHMADHANDTEPWKVPISKDTFVRATMIGRYLIPHAQAAFALMHADPEVEAAKTILEWIKRRNMDSFSRRDLFEGIKGTFKKASALNGPLLLLVVHGYLWERPGPDRPGPGRKPSPVFEVNPLWDRSFHPPESRDRAGTSSTNRANSVNSREEPGERHADEEAPNDSANCEDSALGGPSSETAEDAEGEGDEFEA